MHRVPWSWPNFITTLGLVLCLTLGALNHLSCGRSNSRASQKLVIAQASSILGLDPAQVTDSESIEVLAQVFEHLVRYKPDSMVIEGALARDWERQADGRTWRFFLRKGIRFHDGAPFDADAVVDSFMRQRDGGRMKDGRALYPYWNSYFRNIVQIKRESRFVVRIVTDRPFSPLLASLAMFPVSIISPLALAKMKASGKPLDPVGTGPFRFESWDQGTGRIVLTANQSYWGDKPQVNRVEFLRIPHSRERLRALQSGMVHIARSLSPEDMQLARLHPAVKLSDMPENNVVYVALNNERTPFHDPRLRWAVNHAIRKEALIGLVYQGMAKPAIGPLPPGLKGYYTGNVERYDYNPSRAREYLQAARYDRASRPRFLVSNVPRPYLPLPLLAARMIAQDLAAIGMPVEIVPMPFSEFKDAMARGEHQLALHGWVGDNGDPDNYLYNLLDSDNAGRGQGLNFANFKNYRYHRLVMAARESSNRSERERYYHEAQQIVAKEAPWAPICHAKHVVAFRREVKNVRLHPTAILYLHPVKVH